MIPALIAGAATIGSSLIGSKSAKRAQQAQQASEQANIQLQRELAAQQRKDLMEAQQKAVGGLTDYYTRAQDIASKIPGEYQYGLEGYADRLGDVRRDVEGTIGQGYESMADYYNKALGSLQSYSPQATLGQQASAYEQGLQRSGQYLEPYTTAGTQALDMYAEAAMDPYSSALFQRRLAKGQEALNQQLASQGLLNSSAQLELQKDLYADLSAEEEQMANQRLANLAQMGYGAGGQLSGLAGQYGGQYAQDVGTAGQMGYTQARDIGSMYKDIGQLNLEEQQQMADIASQFGLSEADVYKQIAGLKPASMEAEAQALRDLGIRTAGVYTGTGTNLAGVSQGLASNLGDIYSQAGENAGAYQLYRGNINQGMISDLAKLYGSGAFDNIKLPSWRTDYGFTTQGTPGVVYDRDLAPL